ncbi:MAG: Stk1 family PASTA domain-containing Ser/Thr kinase [Acidimicrobiales bacterium]
MPQSRSILALSSTAVSRSRLADEVGRVVGGRYRLLAPVGTGASADVYVADDVRLRRRVAVKVLHDALALDEGFLRRFRAEAQVVASLRHANIMAVYDWGEGVDGPFLVLEYLGGGSLRDLLDRGHRLTPSQAAMAGLEVARGLDHAHRRGLIHRDIKPANLLFDEEGRLAIADFGIARALAEATWTEPAGAVVGTVRYASPEQARGNSIDGRADVYALALVLVEAVTGQVPFAADTTIATLMARLDRPIPVPSEMGALGPVIEAAGAVNPEDRVDAAGLVRALDAAAHNLGRPDPVPLAVIEHLPLPESAVGDETGAFGPITTVGSMTAVRPSPPAHPDLDLTVVGSVPVAGSSAGASTGDRQINQAGERAGSEGGLRVPSAYADLPWTVPSAGAERGQRRRWPWIAAALVVICALLGIGAVAATPLLRPTYVVPALEGHAAAEVVVPHRYPHFRVVAHLVRERGAPRDVVLRQHPGAASHRPAGTVVVDVSVGQPLVAVPDLLGLNQDQAAQRLRDANLVLGTVFQTFSDTVPPGRIASFVGPGKQLEEGSKVDVTVSGGARFIVMPDLAGQGADSATAALAALGVTKEHVSQDLQYSDTVPAGQVVATSPAAGAQGDRGGSITLTVSKGPDTVRVPDETSRSVERAKADLIANGLSVGAVYGPPGPAIVVAQRPSAGAVVKRGSSVVLFGI